MYTDLYMIIDGQPVQGGGRAAEPVVNPATGMPLGRLPHATDADLDAALAAADRAFKGWRRTVSICRSQILRRGAEIIRERVETIARIMTLEQGKPIEEARKELLHGADTIDWYAEEGRRAYGRIIPANTYGVRQHVIHEPVGVAVAFTPWNFPALTPCRKIGGALAAGCTLVLKASEETPGTAVALVQALHEGGLPPGVLNLVFGNPVHVSDYLIESPIIRKVSFTGSVAVGKLLTARAAAGMKRTGMELGGHAPALVFEDVDPEATATLLAAGKFRNAGQVCVSPTRFYVHENVFDRFVARFVDAARTIRVGDGLLDGTTMGPLANPRRVKAMERLIADARTRGGIVQIGGECIGNEGYFFTPTVVTNLPDDSLLMTEEPFGPIAPIVRFRDLDEVLARANSLPFGLASYAFTRSNATASAVSDGLRAGMVGLNTLAISNPETPFGGIGDSGHGQECGIEGLQAYLEIKFVANAAAT